MDSAIGPRPKVPSVKGYRILHQLGEGGMGTVYAAQQLEPIERRVAVKVVRRGMDSAEVLKRFELERQALSMMEHANIAHVLDAGLTDDGLPYFVMELVNGVPITEFADHQTLSIVERIGLFQQVCRGVQHAHQKGVIHRDLKPSNVLVELRGTECVVKIIDFGLARATDNQRIGKHTIFTEQGQILGTPEYMSPEQAETSGLDIDARADIYSLGVLLYELLVGELPFDRRSLQAAAILEMQRQIIQDEPPKPSTRLIRSGSSVDLAKKRATRPGGLLRSVRGELDWITMCALEKDRTRRYQTPTELAADLQRYLDGDPVNAAAPSVTYRFRKFARRYRGQLVAVAAVFTVLIVGTVVALQQRSAAVAARLDYERLKARVELANLETAAEQLFPEGAGQIAAMQDWIQRAERLVARRSDHLQTIARLRARDDASYDDELEEWTLADAARQFLHDSLLDHLADLDAFRGKGGTLALVQDSLDWSTRLAAESTEKYTDEWREVISRIDNNPTYGGLKLVPQVGFVPMGTNRGWLEEFWHPRTGEKPQYNQRGRLEMGPEAGMVFVLVPGGTFTMGSPEGVGYPNERPPHEVTLGPFLASKFEMTQGQYERLTGRRPSKPRAGVTLGHPIESVSWHDAMRCSRRVGFDLPTEAQWEYLCRAKTTTRWWCGDEQWRLQAKGGMVNIADGFKTMANPHPLAAVWPDYQDGFTLHAQVGKLPPNPWGFFEVHGNVAEWCRSPYTEFGEYEHAPGHGEWLGAAGVNRVMRGGSYMGSADDCRSARRRGVPPTSRYDNIGFRPIRELALAPR